MTDAVPQDLQDYIRQARSFGQPDVQIRSSLIHNGWTEMHVDAALRDTRPLPPEPPRRGRAGKAGVRVSTGANSASSATGALVAVVIGVVMVLFSGVLYLKEKDLQDRGTTASGVVSEIRHHQRTEEDDDGYRYTVDYYQPYFAFEDSAGVSHQFSGNDEQGRTGYRVGQNVIVLYDPENPSNVRLAGASPLGFIIGLGVFGAVFTVLALVAFLVAKRKPRSHAENSLGVHASA